MPRLRPLAALLALSALLSACLPAPLRSQSGSALKLDVSLSGAALKVDTARYRRPGPASVNVRVGGASGAYLYGLLLPGSQTARLIEPAMQPGAAVLTLPPVEGFTQLFVVASARPLSFGPLGSTVQQVGEAVGAATAGLPAGSWNVSTQVYSVSDYGALSVRSFPQGANVYLGNTYQGRTPLRLDNVEAGRAQLRVELSGFESETRSLTVTADQRAEVDLRLRELPSGRLLVSSTVSASLSLLRVDGLKSFRQSGAAPAEYKLLPGGYALTVTPRDAAIRPTRLGLQLARSQRLSVSCTLQETVLVCRTD